MPAENQSLLNRLIGREKSIRDAAEFSMRKCCCRTISKVDHLNDQKLTTPNSNYMRWGNARIKSREAELNCLKKKFASDEFQMVVLYGRRRIGKTELMNEFMRRQTCKCISFTASEQSERELLSIMTETVLAELVPDMTGMAEFTNFEKLFEFIGSKAKDKDERIVFCR